MSAISKTPWVQGANTNFGMKNNSGNNIDTQSTTNNISIKMFKSPLGYKDNVDINMASSSVSSTPSDNVFSFESPSSSAINSPNESVFDFEKRFQQPGVISVALQEQPVASRDSILENDITDIIDDYVNSTRTPDTSFAEGPMDRMNHHRLSCSPALAIKRARRQSSVYQDSISIISEDDLDLVKNNVESLQDKKRRVYSISRSTSTLHLLKETASQVNNIQHNNLPKRYNSTYSLNQSKLSVNICEQPGAQRTTTGNGFSAIFRTASLRDTSRQQQQHNLYNARSSVYTHLVTNGIRPSESAREPIGHDFYKLSSNDYYGNHFEFSELANKVVLVVNISFYGKLASKNFRFLNYLHEKYSSKGLVIIGFPCNQFNFKPKQKSLSFSGATSRASGSPVPLHKRSVSLSDLSTIVEQQRQLTSLHSRAVSNSTMFSDNTMSHGNGSLSVSELIQKHNIKFPVFEHVKVNGKNSCDIYNYLKNEKNGLLGTKFIKWNFEKFIVDRSGRVHKRSSCLKNIKQIEDVVREMLDDSDVLIDSCHSLVGFNESMFD